MVLNQKLTQLICIQSAAFIKILHEINIVKIYNLNKIFKNSKTENKRM